MAGNGLNIKNCRECGKIFSGAAMARICPDCIRLDEENFKKVRFYVNQNKGVDINIVAEETQVSKDKIMQYLRSGKLQASGALEQILTCGKCGVAIHSGKFCPTCSTSMAQALDPNANKKAMPEEVKKSQGMHFKKKLE